MRKRPDTSDTEPVAGGRTPAHPLLPMSWTVVEGPDRDRVFSVADDRSTIGTADGNTMRLTDPTVSGRHAEVRCTGQGLVLTDLGSRNGTFLDEHRIMQAFIAPGARVRLGRTALVLSAGATAAPLPACAVDVLGDLIAAGPAMRQVFALLRRVAPSDVTVVLSGETGTGKDLAARAVHALSARAARPFVVLDCSALDRDLVSAELFGHEAGAFTGASEARPGVFERADGGTLFLDEVGELSLELQPKLLRALEQREVKRLGGHRALRFDCRVIAATHRDLLAMSRDGTFRQDLYYRLAQVPVALPPLRARPEDIGPIAERLLERAHAARGGPARFESDALAALATWPFPGNVRELRNLVERAHLFATGGAVALSDLSPAEQAGPTPAAPAASRAAPQGRLETAERLAILRTLEETGYNRTKAAAALGISLPTLRKRIRAYGIETPRDRDAD